MHQATVTPFFPTTAQPAPRPYLSAAPAPTTTTAPTAKPKPTITATAPRLDDVDVKAPVVIEKQVIVEKADPIRGLLAAAVDGLNGVQDELVARARMEIVELALHVARHVVGEQVAWGAFDMQPLVDAALAQLGEALDVVVRVGPAQHAAVTAALADRTGLRVQLEPAFGAGDLVVDSDGGSVDARLEQRLEAVTRAVRTSVASQS